MATVTRRLSSEQVRAYHEAGFVVVEDVITGKLLAELRAICDDYLERSRHLSKSDDTFDLEPTHTAGDPQLRRIRSPIRHEEIFRKVALEGAIPAIVAELIGPNVKFHHGKINIKIARAGSEAKWHQDFAFMPHTNAESVAVLLAIDDSTLENGCIWMVPGSHRGPVYSHFDQSGQFVGTVTDPAAEPEYAKAVAVPARAGSMSVHHSIMLHSSQPNFSERSRRLYINQYVAADSFAFSPNSSATEYDGYIVAGEASKVARVEARTILMPPDFSKGYRSVFALQQAKELDY